MLQKYFKLKVIDEIDYYLDLFFSHDKVCQHMLRAKDNSHKTVKEIAQLSYLGIQGQFKTTFLTKTKNMHLIQQRFQAHYLLFHTLKTSFQFTNLENFRITHKTMYKSMLIYNLVLTHSSNNSLRRFALIRIAYSQGT